MRQQAQRLRARISARYVAGGRLQPHGLTKASLDMCLLQLHATLARDWPASFVQASFNPPPPPSAPHSPTPPHSPDAQHAPVGNYAGA